MPPLAERSGLSLWQAAALGLLQGPTELLPVSSSGHIALVPELLGWDYAELDPEARKAFEVALHVGTAAALSLVLRHEIAEVAAGLSARRLLGVALAFLPPALAAALFEQAIEGRLGSVRSVAVAQVAAGLALGLADLRPARRSYAEAGPLDHGLLGLGQAAALAPGVSRGGGSLTMLRLRGFERDAAHRLARHAALPIILAAAGLKGTRVARRRLAPELARPFMVGAAASFASTIASRRLIALMDGARSYRMIAAYRVALGVVVLLVCAPADTR